MLLIIPLYICMSMDTNLEQAFYMKSERRLPSAETRWRTCEEAFAATAGPKRREALATGARQKKSGSRLLSAETRWRACEEAFAATAGPKRREALATGAKHGKLDTEFYTFFIRESRDSFSRLKPIFIGTSMLPTISTTNGQVGRMSPI
jgi:hypothetical protein